MTCWTWAAASCRGTSHIRAATRRQDAFSCAALKSENNAFITVVSDGAGSAPMGGQGASLVCRLIMIKARKFIAAERALPSDEQIYNWVAEIRDNIAEAAALRELKKRDFAATLILAMSFGTETLVAHVGDGSVVVQDSESKQWGAISWPAQGEYASTTFFVTDKALNIRFTRHTRKISALVVFTDGVERLALNMATNQAHSPFFQGITRPLFESSVTGCDLGLSRMLKAYLDSDAINARTDDDKTVVLAVCQ